MSPPYPENVQEQERKSLDRVFWRWSLGPEGQSVLAALWEGALAWEQEKRSSPPAFKTDGLSGFLKRKP